MKLVSFPVFQLRQFLMVVCQLLQNVGNPNRYFHHWCQCSKFAHFGAEQKSPVSVILHCNGHFASQIIQNEDDLLMSQRVNKCSKKQGKYIFYRQF